MIDSDSIISKTQEIERFYEITSCVLADIRKLKDAGGVYMFDPDISKLGADTIIGIKFKVVHSDIPVFRSIVIIDGSRHEKSIL